MRITGRDGLVGSITSSAHIECVVIAEMGLGGWVCGVRNACNCGSATNLLTVQGVVAMVHRLLAIVGLISITFPASADDPKKPVDPAVALIDRLEQDGAQDTG